MASASPLGTRIATGVEPAALRPRQVEYEFRRRLTRGARLRPAGQAREDPERLLAWGYSPKSRIELFDATYYLTNIRYDENFRFYVAYVVLGEAPDEIHPRIFYKDSSLVWRAATHYIRTDHENWIGKGALKLGVEDGEAREYSAEETTNLPLEIQAALDVLSRRLRRVPRDDDALSLVLRNAPPDRMDPYADFTAPRDRAMSDPRNLVNGGREVAWFERAGAPGSLRFAPGFEPDFAGGVLEESRSASRLYGGPIRKFRILSRNALVQYQFISGLHHTWIIPPQTLTTEIMSYGLRTVDVHADEDAFVPGYEYHFVDESESPPRLHSQIPEGFAGPASEVDPSRADASPWLEKLPVIQEFRRVVLRAA